MLSIYFGRWDINDEKYIWDMDSFFDYEYDNSWINNEVSKQIIKDIDNSEVIKDKVIYNDIYGAIIPEDLSSGCKMLITMNILGSKYIYNGTKCGDNCSDWILKIANEKDITISRNYTIEFSDKIYKIKIINDGSFVHNDDELFDKIIKFL